jgi:hypothetical protein
MPIDARGHERDTRMSAFAVRVHDSTRRYCRVDRLVLLERLRGRSWRYGELIAAICDWFGCAESTARRNLRLALDYEYVERVSCGYHITPLAQSQLEAYGCLTGAEGLRFARYCSGRPGLHLRRATVKSAGATSARTSFWSNRGG